MHVEARGQHWVSLLRHSLPCFGETGALLGLELTELARLVDQRAPGIPCFRHSSTAITSTGSFFHLGSGSKMETLCLCGKPFADSAISHILLFAKYMQGIFEAKETRRRKLTLAFSYMFTVFFGFQSENHDLPVEDTFYQCHEGTYFKKVIQKSLPCWLFDYLLTERQGEENSNTEDMAAASGTHPPIAIILGQHRTYCNAAICNHSPGLEQACHSIHSILLLA